MAVEEDTGGIPSSRRGGGGHIRQPVSPRTFWMLPPNLRWVQAFAAGVDSLAGTGLLEHGITLTSSSGINSLPIAESCLTFMLMNEKKMVRRVEAQARREWTRITNGQLAGKTVRDRRLGRYRRQRRQARRRLRHARPWRPPHLRPRSGCPQRRRGIPLSPNQRHAGRMRLRRRGGEPYRRNPGHDRQGPVRCHEAGSVLYQRLPRRGRRRGAAPCRTKERPGSAARPSTYSPRSRCPPTASSGACPT